MPARFMTWMAAAAVAVTAAIAAASAQAAATWTVKGAGYGHGVGMSAYGALGFAQHGYTAEQILNHYFPRIRIGSVGTPTSVRVLLASGASSATVSGVTGGCGQSLRPGASYRIVVSGRTLQVRGRDVKVRCSRRVQLTSSDTITIAGVGRYRGSIEIRSGSAGLTVINIVDVEDYTRGVLPGEVPPSWPKAALEAMAIAVRSVGLSTDVKGTGFALYADTRTQVYRGAGAETATTNRAARVTRGRVAMYQRQVAQTFYFSSSGGQTEAAFAGGPKIPYLASVKDPYDSLAPQHRWTMRFTQRQIDARLAGLVKGHLRAVKIVQRGDSPRIVRAVLVGTGGRSRVTGSQLQSALGLYSTWASFARTPGRDG